MFKFIVTQCGSEPEHVKLQFSNVGTRVCGSLLRPSQMVWFYGCGWFMLAEFCAKLSCLYFNNAYSASCSPNQYLSWAITGVYITQCKTLIWQNISFLKSPAASRRVFFLGQGFQQCPSGKLTEPTLQQDRRAELNTGSKSRLWEALELILQLDIFLGLSYAGGLCSPFSRPESGRCQVNLSPQLPPAFPRLWIFYNSLKRSRRECHPHIEICYAWHYTSIIYTESKSLLGHL